MIDMNMFIMLFIIIIKLYPDIELSKYILNLTIQPIVNFLNKIRTIHSIIAFILIAIFIYCIIKNSSDGIKIIFVSASDMTSHLFASGLDLISFIDISILIFLASFYKILKINSQNVLSFIRHCEIMIKSIIARK